MSDYYTIPAISASGLKLLKRSPAHYHASLTTPRIATPAMMLGSATHAAILEPHEFDNRYTVMPEGLDRRTKEGRAVYDAIIASGKQALSVPDMALVRGMQQAVHADTIAQKLWSLPHNIETEIYFKARGYDAKMKPDFYIEPCRDFPNGLIVDLKTTPDASRDAFGAAVWRQDMAIQAAFYIDNLLPLADFWWLAVEKNAPHLVAFYKCTPKVLDYGRELVSDLLDTYEECMRDGIWPGYADGVQDISLPGWTDMGDDSIEFSFDNEETET
jgi:exodeoxyribonuclease VIII